ncbi:MAG: bifunctional diaminohydroxyphosphoribosylaminopyrimidine deaminase/5-amino-6-(5-phosphoribosylamino)uracil reductase RibD [Deltaproteobacteria bacterium]
MRHRVEYFMRQALGLAARGASTTLPNPCVGAVVVKAGRIVGRGFHERAGMPHAEVLALRQAGPRARGATLYCTLEPCDHQGRTGPCTRAVMRAGIRRVFIGTTDPNPLVNGRGIRRLRRYGIEVRAGFLEKEGEVLNRPYLFAHRRRRPMVTVKVAASLDGKTATRTGASRWITDADSRRHAHRARASFDAIMVGIGTVLADDPRLEAPLAYVRPWRPGAARRRTWTKIVVDSRGRLPLRSRLLRTAGRLVVAAAAMSRGREEALRRKGALVVRCPAKGGRVDLKRLMKALYRLEVRHVLAEGGATLRGSLFDARLADRAVFYLAPMVIAGEKALPAVGGEGAGPLKAAARLRNVTCRRLKNDLLIEGDVVYPGKRRLPAER